MCASTIGFVTLLIAHNLQLDGDSLEMLRAVLDTNVWLATHVLLMTAVIFGDKSLKTVCFDSLILKHALKQTHSVCLRAF